jgi:hypothetical protein
VLRRPLPPALRLRDFRLLVAALVAMGLAAQMSEVAIGWQVYAVHRSALDLGLIGLAEFLPLLLLALPAATLPTGCRAGACSRRRSWSTRP